MGYPQLMSSTRTAPTTPNTRNGPVASPDTLFDTIQKPELFYGHAENNIEHWHEENCFLQKQNLPNTETQCPATLYSCG